MGREGEGEGETGRGREEGKKGERGGEESSARQASLTRTWGSGAAGWVRAALRAWRRASAWRPWSMSDLTTFCRASARVGSNLSALIHCLTPAWRSPAAHGVGSAAFAGGAALGTRCATLTEEGVHVADEGEDTPCEGAA